MKKNRQLIDQFEKEMVAIDQQVAEVESKMAGIIKEKPLQGDL